MPVTSHNWRQNYKRSPPFPELPHSSTFQHRRSASSTQRLVRFGPHSRHTPSTPSTRTGTINIIGISDTFDGAKTSKGSFEDTADTFQLKKFDIQFDIVCISAYHRPAWDYCRYVCVQRTS